MSQDPAREPLSDDVEYGFHDADYSGDGEAASQSEPIKRADANGVVNAVDIITVDRDSASGIGDELQWGYVPKSALTAWFNNFVPHGGGVSNVYNMCAVTLGSGIFSLPYAFKSTGIATAVVVLVAISLATVYSVYIMSQAVEKTRGLAKKQIAERNNMRLTAEKTPNAEEPSELTDAKRGARPSILSSFKHLNGEGSTGSSVFLCSYESLSGGLLGRGWGYFAAFNMWFFCFGSCVSYVITVNDLIATALKPNVGEAPREGFLFENEWGSKVLTMAVWAVIMLPLSIPKQVNSLRYVSIVGVTFIMYFVIVLIVHSCQNSFYNDNGTVRLKNTLRAAKSGNEALVGFSMFLFAFLLQTNVLQIQKESKSPSPARLTRDCGIATTICTTLYILAGLFGYAEFGELLEGTILREYQVRKEPAVAVGFVLLGFKLCVSFAICMLPSRDSVYYCLGTDARTISYPFHVLVIVISSVVALVLGLVIPDVEIVFSLVGSFSGGFLGFVFPALFIMYAGNWTLKSVGIFHWTCTYLLLLSGVVAIVFGTVSAIYGIL